MEIVAVLKYHDHIPRGLPPLFRYLQALHWNFELFVTIFVRIVTSLYTPDIGGHLNCIYKSHAENEGEEVELQHVRAPVQKYLNYDHSPLPSVSGGSIKIVSQPRKLRPEKLSSLSSYNSLLAEPFLPPKVLPTIPY